MNPKELEKILLQRVWWNTKNPIASIRRKYGSSDSEIRDSLWALIDRGDLTMNGSRQLLITKKGIKNVSF